MVSEIFVRQGGLLEEVGISLDFRIPFERKKGWHFVAKDGKDNGLREGTIKQSSQTACVLGKAYDCAFFDLCIVLKHFEVIISCKSFHKNLDFKLLLKILKIW